MPIRGGGLLGGKTDELVFWYLGYHFAAKPNVILNLVQDLIHQPANQTPLSLT